MSVAVDNLLAKEVVIIKLGGSSITDKAKLETLQPDVLNWVSKTLKSALHERYLSPSPETTTQNEDSFPTVPSRKAAFIIVHGAGSFGHQCAKQYGLSGKSEPPPEREDSNTDFASVENLDMLNEMERKRLHDMTGLAKTRASVQKLNNEVVRNLNQFGINAVGLSPCITIPGVQAHGGDEHGGITSLVTSIKQALLVGLVPVIHGDAGYYGLVENGPSSMSAGILGGDTLVEAIATHEFMKMHLLQAIFLTDVDGVYSKDPKLFEDAKLLKRIDIDNQNGRILTDLSASGSTHVHDVTGGLETKLGAAAAVAKSGIDVNIVRCSTKNAKEVICGKDTDRCTVIRGVFQKKVHDVIT